MTEEYISNCLQLAMLLEVSAYPKPGNVHRTASFSDTKFEHFLASAIAIGEQFRKAAKRGIMTSRGRIKFEEIGIGKMIHDSVKNMMDWQRGGNTSLGIILLLLPLATAAGIVMNNGDFSIKTLRESLKKVTKSTTCMDTIEVFNAIRIAVPGGLGKVQLYDLNDKNVEEKIQKERKSLFEIFQISSSYDSIAGEWVGDYSITFDIGYPYLCDCIRKNFDVNKTTVQTFLKILSEVPDSLISRKFGSSQAKEVTAKAKEILELGGITTEKGKNELYRFDNHLRSEKLSVNPGTTADLTTSTLAVAILNGYRP